ncbi:hypothetical protein [Paraburkholderia hayleyella]|uniref:hypothetical protein n=1 Tax=Paraburkholderia hayleyella TaxID=2152889 RepID=UPI00129217BD|nr:hypothetical protein [Paraburkholderia hayleyella]
MKTNLIEIAMAVLVVSLVGCGEKEADCKNPRTQQEQQKCAHDAMTDNAIGRTPNPKKW